MDKTDYPDLILKDLNAISKHYYKPRYVPLAKRERRSDLSLEAVKALMHGKYMAHWKGVDMLKSALETVAIQQLLWELAPRTIFEVGAYRGGTALWLADIVKLYGLDATVYAIDINLDLLAPEARQAAETNSHLVFLQGDMHNPAVFLPDAETLPHPWLVLEDCHVALTDTLGYFHAHGLHSGDYLIVEDTSPDCPAASGMGLDPDVKYERYGDEKLNLLHQFLSRHPDEYYIDRNYTDMFGYNGTVNWDGYLRRM